MARLGRTDEQRSIPQYLGADLEEGAANAIEAHWCHRQETQATMHELHKGQNPVPECRMGISDPSKCPNQRPSPPLKQATTRTWGICCLSNTTLSDRYSLPSRKANQVDTVGGAVLIILGASFRKSCDCHPLIPGRNTDLSEGCLHSSQMVSSNIPPCH